MGNTAGTDRRDFLKYAGTAAAVSTLGMAGCLGDDSGSLEQLTVTQGQFIETPDPNDHITSPYYNIFNPVYEPLFEITPDIELESGIVTDRNPTGEGATELTVRDDVVFHDGQEMTASDVAFTMRRIVNDDVGPPSDQAFGVPNITGAEALDDTTVRIDHPDVSPALAEFQYGQFIRVLSEEWVNSISADNIGEQGAIVGPDSADAFNGTGPYEVVEYVPDERIVMEEFDDYWGEVPPIQEVTWNENNDPGGRVDALQAGETDIIDQVPPDSVNNVNEGDGTEVRNETSLRSIFLVMKEGHEPFDSREFRRAMNFAVDNQGIIDSVLNGFGAPMTQMHSEDVFGADPSLEPYEQDVEMAESLVEESGYAGVDIELAVGAGRYLNDQAVAETCANEIDQLSNVNCSLNVVDFPRVSDANSAGIDGDPEMPFFLIGWGVITADANYGISPWIEPDGGLQVLDVPDIWDRLQETQVEQDTDTREQQLQGINADLREEAPFVFLHSQDSIYGVDSDLEWEPRIDESIFLSEIQ